MHSIGGLMNMKASETHWNSMNSPFWLSFEPAVLLSFQMSKSSFPSLLHCNQCSKIHTSYFFRWRLLTLLGAFFPRQTSRLIYWIHKVWNIVPRRAEGALALVSMRWKLQPAVPSCFWHMKQSTPKQTASQDSAYTPAGSDSFHLICWHL